MARRKAAVGKLPVRPLSRRNMEMQQKDDPGNDENETCQLCLNRQAKTSVELGEREVPVCWKCKANHRQSDEDFKELMRKLKKLRDWEREVWGR